MRTPDGKQRLSAVAIAVQAALLATYGLSAHAEDADVMALTTPDNFVEIGVTSTDKGSAKFGEYSGLNKSGAEPIGNFSVRGGDYGSETGNTRWSINGSNLGLTSRELGASYSRQGSWNIGIGYDELRHNTSDTYQTPYQGSMGGNNFTLPAGFTAIGNTTQTTADNLTAENYAKFRTMEVNNSRKTTGLTAGYALSPQLRITFDYKNLEQSGAKLMGFSSDGNIAAGVNGERPVILPNPTNYTTDTVNIALDWMGDKGHLTGGYFGSYFRDHYDRVNWTTYSGALATDTMATAPGNQFHQFNLSGAYRFSPQTKLAGGLSYGRNTQDATYVVDPADMVSMPQNSLNGSVVTTHADLKLVEQLSKDLKLSAGLIYNKRDNRTTSNVYAYHPISDGTYEISSAPYSYDKAQYELAADYRLAPGNSLRLAYNYDNLKRWCNSYGASAEYPAGTACLVDTATKEQKLSLGYRLKAGSVDLNAKYVYADRSTDYNPLAQVALESVRGGTDYTTGTNLGIPGLNGGDFPGFHPLFDASRKQHQFKAGVNFQASEAFSLGLNGRYAEDNYDDAAYGPQDGKSWNVNLDATFNYSDNGALFAYVSQDYRSRYINHVTDSSRTSAGVTTRTAYVWGDRMKDQGSTVGLGFKQGGLLGGKLDIKGDLAYSDATSNYSSDFLAFISGSTTATSCAAANSMTCGSTPDIANKLTQVKLTGTYKLDKKSKVAVGYLYQELSSDDYFYNAYQYLYSATGVLPTNQQSGDYKVNLVAVSYLYSFK
jgi:MtrB/PioB family decaheme-associated outer membrane protein